MRGKLLFVAGIAAGYVLGTRAGRPAYDAITARVQGFRENPTVVQAGEKAKAVVEDKAPKVAETAAKVTETATAAASAASDAGTASSASSSDSTPAPKPGDAAKPSAPAKPTDAASSTPSAGA